MPSDYQIAVQNPQLSFRDPALRASTAVRTKLGLPQVAAGNFACVFKLKNKSDTFAVRCFLRPVTDQKRRYDLLSKHLETYSSPYLVGFDYIEEGIRIHGQWFPIVNMEWVDGETLDNFVQRHINNPKMLRLLAARWRGLVASLRGAFMAHGDLQHGNVLVVSNGQLLLVDYDDMFLSTLSGEKSPEIGHANYQHPQRTDGDYNYGIDNFAALVIYTSLRALATEPKLWNDFNTANNLILTQADYNAPKQSRCFKRLESSQDPQVVELAKLLEECCSKPVTTVQYLENVLQSLDTPLPPPPYLPKTKRKKTPTRAPTQVAEPVTQKVICPKCGRAYDPDQVYCHKCLAWLQGSRVCRKCKSTIPANAPFCPECGTRK